MRDAILIGLVLASLIMVLFLRDWGTSLVAGLVIPATIAITFIMLRVMNESFNLMTLGGLAAAVGLVIDDAIVVVENIVHAPRSRPVARRSHPQRHPRDPRAAGRLHDHADRGLPPADFDHRRYRRLLPRAGGHGGRRAADVARAGAHLDADAQPLPHPQTEPIATPTAGPGRLMRIYERALRTTLEHPLILAVFALVLIGGSYLCYTHTGSDLLPAMDEGGFIIDYIMPAGSSLEETNRVITHVEEILRKTPEVESTSRRTGLQLGLAQVTEANTGDISVKLKRDRKRSGEEVIAAVRAKIKKAEPVLDVEFPQLLQDMIGDLTSAPEPVVIKLFSQDPDLLHAWAPQIAGAIKKIPGVVDVLDGVENTISGPARVFSVDPAAAARAGFTTQEVELDASAMLQGEPAPPPVVVNDRAYNIRVRFPQRTRASLDTIQNTLLISGTGKTGTIGTLAVMREIPGQTEIRRENLQRNVQVTARFEDMNLGDGMKKVQQVIDDLKVPPSIRIQYGGQFEEQQKSFKDLVFVLVLAIVLVFTVLLFEFGNFAAPLAVISSALLSTCGVFLALLITGTTFNISSFMGLIMVIGIVAKNGILLLDADQKFRAEGFSAEDAMIRAGERRLRPIMMTALATVAGMIPLALALGAGSQMLQPLAIAVIGGILASMVLSLVVTPAVHYYIGGRHN